MLQSDGILDGECVLRCGGGSPSSLLLRQPFSDKAGNRGWVACVLLMTKTDDAHAFGLPVLTHQSIAAINSFVESCRDWLTHPRS